MGKPKGDPPVRPCRLCATVGPLTWSHILPRWTYKRITEMGEPGRTVPVQVRDGVAMLNGKQLADFLMCGACEDKFHHWETYVSEVRELMGHDDLETTAGYLHANAADKVAVIDALGQLAGNADTSSSLTH
jgi:hypothetical protein